MSYSLSEAYADLYNPRKAEENALFYDNLRFVDYLSQEDIQEVMESLLWEFIDYGHSLDESYDLISGVFSDSILEEILYETKELYLDEGLGSALTRLGGKVERGEQRLGQFAARQRQRASDTASAARQFGSAQKQRLQARQAQVQTGLSSARKAIVSAPGIVSRAVTGAASRGAQTAGRQVGQAKAALGSLVRKGIGKVASAGERLGSGISSAGARAHTVNMYPVSGGTQPMGSFRRTPVGTSKRERLGGAISRAASRLDQKKK